MSARNASGSAGYGVMPGIVKENEDPENMGRVRIEFPYWENQDVTEWARVATPMAGAEMGAYFLPEVGDEVLVAFEHGDVRYPYVIGCLWNGAEKPPESNDGNNNIRKIKTRSGHEIILNDDDNGAKLTITSSSGNCITLDDASGGECVKIEDKSGNSITLDAASNAISLECSGELKIKGNMVKIDADSTLEIGAGATLKIKGALVQIN